MVVLIFIATLFSTTTIASAFLLAGSAQTTETKRIQRGS